MALDMQIVGCHENMHINFRCLVRFFLLKYLFSYRVGRNAGTYINNLFASTYVNGAKRVIPTHVFGGSVF